MKSINSLKVHEIEKRSMEIISGGAPSVSAGSNGSWSWTAGDYTTDCNYVDPYHPCTTDYSGRVYYDGKQLNGVINPTTVGENVPEEFRGEEAYYFE